MASRAKLSSHCSALSSDIMAGDKMHYSEKHVHLPQHLADRVPRYRLMSESEWRALGIQQSLGWEHYMIHAPEPHIILFRRPRSDAPPPAENAPSKTNSADE
ncbi:Cyclin-dependent kinase regulatory subunit [Taenia solium]|eukprot:TsM_001130500 transcript=TsM_001130500 gene=TsM_001130500